MVLASMMMELFHGSRTVSSTVDHTPEGAEPGSATGEPGVDAFVRAVASNLRYLRAQAGLTLDELAAAAGLGTTTLAQLESR